jgi:hypothetical protein
LFTSSHQPIQTYSAQRAATARRAPLRARTAPRHIQRRAGRSIVQQVPRLREMEQSCTPARKRVQSVLRHLHPPAKAPMAASSSDWWKTPPGAPTNVLRQLDMYYQPASVHGMFATTTCRQQLLCTCDSNVSLHAQARQGSACYGGHRVAGFGVLRGARGGGCDRRRLQQHIDRACASLRSGAPVPTGPDASRRAARPHGRGLDRQRLQGGGGSSRRCGLLGEQRASSTRGWGCHQHHIPEVLPE